MAKAYYFVKQDPNAVCPRKNNVDGMIVVAETAADAKAIAKSKHDVDSDAVWADATATVIDAAADMEGWVLDVKAYHPTTGVLAVHVSVTGAPSATLDSIGALAVTALNALPNIAGAAYAANVLKIAETTDGLGDHRVFCTFKPPTATHENPVTIPGLLGAVVNAGIAAAVLSQAFAADGYTVPTVVAQVKQVA